METQANEIVDRVTQAIFRVRYQSPQQIARAAMAAMHEPTEEMVAVGKGMAGGELVAKGFWQAMLAIALK
jgi:hypothetical protein